MGNFLSSNLKFLRKQNKISQEQLGKRMNKDYSTIGKWEKGTHYPVLDDAYKLSEILNVSIDDLLSKDLTCNNQNFNELDLLFKKNKDVLTEDDKEYIKFIIEKRKKEIDKELGE